MSIFLISQIIGGISLILDVISFQLKDRRHILLLLLASTFCISIHFLLLEKYFAAGVVMISFIRFLVAYYKTDRWLMFVFCGLALGVFFFVGDYSLETVIGLIGMFFFSVAAFQKKDQYLRLVMMPGTALWMLHNFLAWTPIMVFVELVFLTSNVVGYYRYYIRKT